MVSYGKANLNDSTCNSNALLLTTYVKHTHNAQYNPNSTTAVQKTKVFDSGLFLFNKPQFNKLQQVFSSR